MMIYYKHPETGAVFAYETETEREYWGVPELVEMTSGEIQAHLNPAPLAQAIPEQVTRAQGKAAVIQAGLWPQVEEYVAKIADPIEKVLALVALNDTSHWRRDSPTMQAIATELQITSEQMDSLFIQAAAIQL